MTEQKSWCGHCERKNDQQEDICQLSSYYVSFILHYFPVWRCHKWGNLTLDCRKHWNTEWILWCCGTLSIKIYRLCLFHKTGNYSFNCFNTLARAAPRRRGTAVLKLYKPFCAMLSGQSYKDNQTHGIILQRWSFMKCWGRRSKV